MSDEEIYDFIQSRTMFVHVLMLKEVFNFITSNGKDKECVLNKMIEYYEIRIKEGVKYLKYLDSLSGYIGSGKSDVQRDIRTYTELIRSIKDEVKYIELKRTLKEFDNYD